MTQRRADLPPGHSLHGVEWLAFDASSGDVAVKLRDGHVAYSNIGAQRQVWSIDRTVFHTRDSVLTMVASSGEEFTADIGRADERVDRPVVYLDQNHWISLARTVVGSSNIDSDTREACKRLIHLAKAGRIIVPLSAAHVVETTKRGGRQRIDLARVLIDISRGWQMRSPLAIRSRELDSLFRSSPDGLPRDYAFTLEPDAIWRDRLYAPPDPDLATDLPKDLDGIIARISWIASLTDVLLEASPTVSQEGLDVATRWAASFHELALQMRTNPKARRFARDVTRTRFISDMAQDLALAAHLAKLPPDAFGTWVRERAEEALSSLPALGRIREVLHLRLVNADDKWEANDLNDLFSLCSAAAYADVVVGEKKASGYLYRVEKLVPAGGAVFRRLVDAMPTIEEIGEDPHLAPS